MAEKSGEAGVFDMSLTTATMMFCGCHAHVDTLHAVYNLHLNVGVFIKHLRCSGFNSHLSISSLMIVQHLFLMYTQIMNGFSIIINYVMHHHHQHNIMNGSNNTT